MVALVSKMTSSLSDQLSIGVHRKKFKKLKLELSLEIGLSSCSTFILELSPCICQVA